MDAEADAQAKLAETGEILLEMGIIPDKPYLDAMGIDEPTARGIQSIIWLSKEGDPEAQRAVEAMIDLTDPQTQVEQRQEAEIARVPADANIYALNGFDDANHSTGFGMMRQDEFVGDGQGNNADRTKYDLIPNTLTDIQKSRLNTLGNTINDHLTESDFSGALRDLQGNPVPNGSGGYFDHVHEIKDSYRSLQKIRRALEGSLKNPTLSDVDRALLQEGLDLANYYIEKIEELFDPYGGIR